MVTIITSFTSLTGAITPSGIEGAIKVVIVIFAILLFTLSVSTYKKTGIKKMMYAAAAILPVRRTIIIRIFGGKCTYVRYSICRYYTRFYDPWNSGILLNIYN